jgi:pimeloyl-ACP methyl ester carboxylesterase
MATPLAEPTIAADGMAFIDRLWRDWSPGLDGGKALAEAKRSLAGAENLRAAIGYYRAALEVPPAPDRAPYAAEQAAIAEIGPQPTLYLHGSDDGCVAVELVGDAERYLSEASRMEVIEGVGHFLHLERPDEVNERILAFLGG